MRGRLIALCLLACAFVTIGLAVSGPAANSSDQRARGNCHEVRGTSAGMIIVITPHRLRQQPLIPFRFYAPFFTDISAAFSKRD
jgi:hypothetical protein